MTGSPARWADASGGHEPTDADARALEADLRQKGIVARVERRGTLAILNTTMTMLTDPEQRALAVMLARTRGFTHVALEIA